MKAILAPVFCFFAVTTSATTISKEYHESGVGFFNVIQIFVFAPGAQLQPPGMSSFSDPSWNNYDYGPHWSSASGNICNNNVLGSCVPDDLYFNINVDYVATPTIFHVYAFIAPNNTAGATNNWCDICQPFMLMADSAQLTYEGGDWGIVEPMTDPRAQYRQDVASASAPEPATFVLFGVGVFALGWRVRTRYQTPYFRTSIGQSLL